ncbi:TIGR02996 domain-containing protein [bacterium]|nr:TIGR02996 domain-containing protein [bacterium]
MGYDSTYERDLYLQVWGGRVVLIEEFENPPPEPEWEAGDTDDTFGRRFQRYIDWGNAPARQLRSEVTAQLEAVFGSDEAAFLRAVRAEPSARTPRLVYADWLDDRGDPRAGFIRHEEARPPAGTDPDATAEWERVRAEQLRRVKHWLWVKLMGYPLPKTRWGAEMTEW